MRATGARHRGEPKLLAHTLCVCASMRPRQLFICSGMFFPCAPASCFVPFATLLPLWCICSLACSIEHLELDPQAGLKECGRCLQGARYTHNFDLVSFVNDDTFRITMIACGDLHCLALSNFGTQLYSWGCAANGRLGYEVLSPICWPCSPL